MRKHLLSLGLVTVTVAGCTFDNWSGSAPDSPPTTRRTVDNDSANIGVSDLSTDTYVSPMPDETISRVQGFTQRAKLDPAKPAHTITPATYTAPPPRPKADPVPAVVPPVAAGSPDLSTSLSWLDNRPVDLNLGPKQDPTPPVPVPVTPDPAPAVAAPAPVGVPATTPDPLEARLTQTALDYPRDLSAQLDYQLLQFLKGRQVTPVEGLSTLPRDDREMLWALMDSLGNLRSNLKSDVNMAAAQKARPLVNLGERLRAGADLRVGAIALCTRVDGFGVYQPMPVDRLPSGRETTAVLYCEVENFLSRQTDGGQWETNLSQEITLYNDRGQRVWSEKAKPVKDLCRNRRHDFFVGQRITLPSALPPGSYSLRVTIVDQNANRVNESTLALRVAADR